MPESTPPAPQNSPDPLSDSRALEDMAEMLLELDTSDSLDLTDSAIGLILDCVDETDSAVRAAQLESEMIKSLNQLAEPNPAPPANPPKAR